MPVFRFSIQDNDSYAFRDYASLSKHQRVHQALVPSMSGEPLPAVRRCQACGELMSKWDEALSDLKIRNRKFDLSITYDGILVGSQRFRAICDAEKLSGLVFRELPRDPDFYSIQASRSVEFDSHRRMTRFENLCPHCGRYESIVGATPVLLKDGDIGELEFVRTNLEFGSGDEKHPLMLCGQTAAETLKHSKLRGLHVIPIDT